MKYSRKERNSRKTPKLCETCESVLSDFERKRCSDCRFIARYVGWNNVMYFVAQDYDKMFKTFFIDAETKKRRVYQKLSPTFSFVEAQSQLNHHAIERKWRNCRETAICG